MNRQYLKALASVTFALLVLGALPGCTHRPVKPYPPEAASIQVFVHGTLIVKTPSQDDGTDGIQVFAPRDGDQRRHEMVSPDRETPGQPEKGPCKVTFHIKLVGVDPYHGRPKIDDAFAATTFKVPADWKPKDDPFISMSFPSASKIGYLGPLYPVQFVSGPPSQVPLTEILEYSTKDIHQVKLVQTRVTQCGTAKPLTEDKDLKPLRCEEARTHLQAHKADAESPTTFSQRNSLEKRLDQCSNGTYVYFVGVGLPSAYLAAHPDLRMKHGVEFFNERLLVEIFGSENKIPPGRKLVSVGEEKPYGNPSQSEGAPKLLPTVFTFGAPEPLLKPVASTENCNSPGAILR
jgi:hypothetical protein